MADRSLGATDIVTCDVLVVGGGFAGAWAALRAAECGANVVLAEKAFVSRSGASTMSGGVTTAPEDGDDLASWVEEFVHFSGYTADEEWTWQLINDQLERVRDYVSWGVPIVREPDGTIQRRKSRGMVVVRCLQYSPKRAMEVLRARALAAGARIIDRVAIEELLTTDGAYPTSGRVCGAVGLHTRTAQPVVFRSKSVILTTGPQAMKGFQPIDNCTADGFAMGYRAGGRFVDMEFASGGTFSVFTVGGEHFAFGNYNVAVAHGARLINRHGERFMERYDPVRLERSELNRVVAAFVKEILDGRGPVRIDLTQNGEAYWAALEAVRAGKTPGALISGNIPDPRKYPLVIEPTWSFWNGGRGGLHIDRGGRTSLPGLYAGGGVARNEAVGRHASAGTPTAFAKVSGYRSGEAAAEEARQISLASMSESDIDAAVARVLAPLGQAGPFTTDSLHEAVATILGSPVDQFSRDATRMTEAVDALRAVRELVDHVSVDSPHELVKFHEAASTIDIASLVFSSMIDRIESRENFYREDYPETDDENWRCWHTAELTANGLRFAREAIPYDRYQFKPPPARPSYLSPMAAILQDRFDLTEQLPYEVAV